MGAVGRPAPTDAAAEAPRLPEIPLVDGALAPRVQYPAANAVVSARDSNFIFGTVGSGRATLTINGLPVRVAPNGTWLAYLPLPPSGAPRYDIVAVRGADTARLLHPIRLGTPAAPVPLSEGGRLAIDSASVSPRATQMLRPDERVRVAVRAPANATVWAAYEGGLQTMTAQPGNGGQWATELPARLLRSGGHVVVARGADTVRVPIARVEIADPASPRWVQLGTAAADTDRVVIGRPTPAGTYKWLLLPGTVAEQTGRQEGSVRVRLDSQLEVWVDSSGVVPLAPGTLPAARRTAGNVTLTPSAEWVDVSIPMGSRAPYLIEQLPRRVVLTLYGTSMSPDLIRYLGNDTLVRVVNWVPEANDRTRIDIDLTADPYGYLVLWDAGRLVLRLRRPPAIADARRPLAGLTLVVDAGHPPGGAVGPSGLSEPQAALDVSRRLQRMLEERGARVVMTRTTMEPLGLAERSVIARRANAHALISVHLNAFGDGVNPFTQNGTSTLFFHPQTEPLARHVQRGMMRRLGLRDLGIHYQNIAIGRTTWMPALITEGLFLMVPEQEWAMRSPEGQEAYARGVAEGVEAYFASLGRR